MENKAEVKNAALNLITLKCLIYMTRNILENINSEINIIDYGPGK